MSPSIDAKNVIYIGSEDGFFYALDGNDGELKWKYSSEEVERYRGGRANQASIGANGIIYVCAAKRKGGGLLIALDAETGREKWTSKFDRELSTPVIDETGTIFVGATNGHVYAVDQQTGKQKMRTKDAVGRIESSLALGDDGSVYFGSQDRRIYAIDGKTLEKKWEVRTGDVVDSSPLISDDGVLYIGSLMTAGSMPLPPAAQVRPRARGRCSAKTPNAPAGLQHQNKIFRGRLR